MGEEAAPGRYELQQVPKDMDAEEQAFLRIRSLQLHSIHIWVTSPSVKLIFMDWQSLSQSPK
jgi:hypothetical protein